MDRGTVYFDGKTLSEYGEQELAHLRRTQMGFVFQQPTHDVKIAGDWDIEGSIRC